MTPHLQGEQSKYLMSSRERANLRGPGRARAHRSVSLGEIPCARIGRLRKVRRSDFDAFIEAWLENIVDDPDNTCDIGREAICKAVLVEKVARKHTNLEPLGGGGWFNGPCALRNHDDRGQCEFRSAI